MTESQPKTLMTEIVQPDESGTISDRQYRAENGQHEPKEEERKRNGNLTEEEQQHTRSPP